MMNYILKLLLNSLIWEPPELIKNGSATLPFYNNFIFFRVPSNPEASQWPDIVHFGVKPSQLSYAGQTIIPSDRGG